MPERITSIKLNQLKKQISPKKISEILFQNPNQSMKRKEAHVQAQLLAINQMLITHMATRVEN
jgi:hypothetical protein